MKPRKECIVCENKIYRSNRKGQLKERRQNFALTCSRKCSKIYTRVRCHIAEHYRNRIGILKRKIKNLKGEKGYKQNEKK